MGEGFFLNAFTDSNGDVTIQLIKLGEKQYIFKTITGEKARELYSTLKEESKC